MQKAFFQAMCPVEIGDIVLKKDGAKEAAVIYKTSKMKVNPCSPFKPHKITDIAAIHSVKTRKVVFRYELDGNGVYVSLEFVRVFS